MTTGRTQLHGRLVLDDRVASGRLAVEDGVIAAVELDEGAATQDRSLPYIAPGFVDVHVHGWGGHDAMGPLEDLDGMARALLRRGVTSFLPTGFTTPFPVMHAFADRVRSWIPAAPADGADPLGFNIEGPFIAPARKGAHNPAYLATPADVPWSEIEPLIDGMRLTTVAPEIPGGMDLIAKLRERGVRVSIGHSAADLPTALAGYDAGGTTTTHLFNAMTGVDHHAPGVAVAALGRDDVYVELIADGEHVDRSLWPIITRTKPTDRLMLVSDATPMAGMGDGRVTLGGLEIEIHGLRVTLVDGGALAGSVIALDHAVRNLVAAGVGLPAAVAAASRNPLAMLGITDRGRIAVGQRADLIELDDGLNVRRVMRGSVWNAGAGSD
ncbi:MAG TPA: N-acetylglucosamine-6-phosphate deacetylase [Candidatus Limnocylindrales bacterium]|nr:N-acetylglucosamine-6-phosphate deacetylase [Candidatus Limnocylindrales bacterium]